jgi:hypothetical protein
LPEPSFTPVAAGAGAVLLPLPAGAGVSPPDLPHAHANTTTIKIAIAVVSNLPILFIFLSSFLVWFLLLHYVSSAEKVPWLFSGQNKKCSAFLQNITFLHPSNVCHQKALHKCDSPLHILQRPNTGSLKGLPGVSAAVPFIPSAPLLLFGDLTHKCRASILHNDI